jgi:hypothetical protein
MGNNRILVSSKKDNTLYEFLGEGEYQNLQNKVKGNIDDELASKIFDMPLTLNIVISKNPLIIDLMKSFGNGDCVVQRDGRQKTYKF